MKNFVKYAIKNGGSIHSLMIPAKENNGLGLMNPSIYNDNGKLIAVLRAVNYTFYHSEKKLFQHPYGPLTYIHPEADLHLRTDNWFLELNDDLSIASYKKIDMSRFDTEPKWEFVGLEDARLFRWNSKLFICGVRRDTSTNGEGRMELSQIQDIDGKIVEVSRDRIPVPSDYTYCEKNWMPIINKPYHFVKWTNPTEVVKFDTMAKRTATISLENASKNCGEPRGGSQVIPFGDSYIAFTHEVNLFKSETQRKDAIYSHRIVVWDNNFKIKDVTKQFHMMDGQVEFVTGMTEYREDILISFGFQDNAAFVVRISFEAFKRFIEGHLV